MKKIISIIASVCVILTFASCEIKDNGAEEKHSEKTSHLTESTSAAESGAGESSSDTYSFVATTVGKDTESAESATESLTETYPVTESDTVCDNSEEVNATAATEVSGTTEPTAATEDGEEVRTESLTEGETSAETESTDETTIGENEEETTESPYIAPDFTVYDYEGNEVKLSDFRGKPIVLNFWARNCGYCTMEMPDFQAAYDKYGDKVVFLMVCFTSFSNRGVEYEKEYIDQNGYTFPVYYDTENSAVSRYGINSIPQTFFINSDFDLYTYIPGMASEALLEQCIGYIIE